MAVLSDKFIKYLLVGVLNTAFGYGMFALLIYIGIHYSVSVLGSTTLGVLFNFNTVGRLVFKNSNMKLLFRFVMVYVFAYFVNVALLSLFSLFEVNIYLSGFVLLFPMAVMTFSLNRKFVFGIDAVSSEAG